VVNDASIGSLYILITIFVVNERSAMMYRALLEGGADAPVLGHEFEDDRDVLDHHVEQRRQLSK